MPPPSGSTLVTVTPTMVNPRGSYSGSRRGEERPRRLLDRQRLRRRGVQGVRTAGAGEVAKAHAQDHGAPDPVGLAHAPGDPVDERVERALEVAAGVAAQADRALGAERAPSSAGADGPKLAAGRDRVQPRAVGAAQDRGERVLADRGDVPDRGDPVRAQPRRGRLAHAPDPLDRERVKELPLLARARCAVTRQAWPRRRPSSPRPSTSQGRPRRRARPPRAPRPAGRWATSGGEPRMWSSPRTSRNASSIERPSTTGAVRLKTSKRSLLAAT